MVIVRIKHPLYELSEIREFRFKHSAVTWLLLSGYFPTDCEHMYRNIYTDSLAELEHHS